MKTLANLQDRQILLERLARVRVDSARLWGSMSAPQMVCHLNDSYRLVSGEKPASSVETAFRRTVMKWGALRLPMPWPHGLKTMPEVDQLGGGTPPGVFEADRLELVARTEAFAAGPEYLVSARHPFFGVMSRWEWMRWGYLHMDHHLCQFGV
jgi:hypothetical protein